MASPPFNINQALPGDSDIVSQHPPNARTFRDVVESWLGINHDTNGNHFRVDIPRSSSPSTPAASVDVLYVSGTGRLKIKHPDGTEEFVGTPPGSIMYSAAGVFTGWLLADGSAVSRSTYPDLFGVLGSGFGDGDHSTTFNIPDLRGRMSIGADGGAGRISTTIFSQTSLGGIGGQERTTLDTSNIPGGVPVNVSSLSVTGVSVNVSGSISGSVSAQTSSGSVSGTASGGTVTGSASGTVGGTFSGNTDVTKPIVWDTGGIASSVASGGSLGQFAVVSAVHREAAMAVSGSISATFSSGSISGSLSSAATVSGSFSGATVSAGTVSGSFSGSGSNGTGGGSGTGATTGSAVAFSNMPPAFVLIPLIKT